LVFKEVMGRRALVLGGGGVAGIAWETGLIAGLAGLGIDLAAADVIIGTSAGSVVGADLASGQQLEALYQAQLAPPAPEPAARMGWGVIGRLLWVMSTSRDPARARARIGRCGPGSLAGRWPASRHLAVRLPGLREGHRPT
jgi:NTE family protein